MCMVLVLYFTDCFKVLSVVDFAFSFRVNMYRCVCLLYSCDKIKVDWLSKCLENSSFSITFETSWKTV